MENQILCLAAVCMDEDYWYMWGNNQVNFNDDAAGWPTGSNISFSRSKFKNVESHFKSDRARHHR